MSLCRVGVRLDVACCAYLATRLEGGGECGGDAGEGGEDEDGGAHFG